jgi:hypothetical protein
MIKYRMMVIIRREKRLMWMWAEYYNLLLERYGWIGERKLIWHVRDWDTTWNQPHRDHTLLAYLWLVGHASCGHEIFRPSWSNSIEWYFERLDGGRRRLRFLHYLFLPDAACTAFGLVQGSSLGAVYFDSQKQTVEFCYSYRWAH